MRQSFLHSNWVFSNVTAKPPYERTAVQYQPWLPATVPGHVHLDLVDNGIIADPFLAMNELGSRWVDESDWSYKAEFHWTPDQNLHRRILRFEGLDTIAEIALNGEVVGHSDNMFLPLEIDVSDRLTEGKNELEIRFSSAVRAGDERRKEYFASEGLPINLKQFDERAFVRKAQYMSAWDWGPRLVSCGIWQPVSLIEFSARVTSFTVFQERLDDGSFKVRTQTETEGAGEVTLVFGDREVTSQADAIQEIEMIVSNPVLWWPNGMGDQHLYLASAKLKDSNEITKKIGLRTLCLEQREDQFGVGFTFVVNGRKVWSRGANWIPNDSFPSRVTKEDYRSQIFDCKTLGMNMLRVWGGGLYELDGFYDACDEAGILVWQDFPYACSYYPDGDDACKVAESEASFHIKRLGYRASLALWCGNNENLMMWQTKWGGEASPPRYYGENIYDKVLPDVIQKLDSQRSYIPSSPVGQSDKEGATANDGGFGDSHYWDVWHGRGDWIYYRDSDTRFSSEFGFGSSCSLELWKQTIPPAQWAHSTPAVRWHDKTGKEWPKFFSYVTTHYPEPQSLEDWTYYSQLNQRDALRFGIEHWRRTEYCQGTLIWQFNDCWPVQSWAVQDYLRLLKPAAYELKRLYADRLVSLLRTENGIEIYLINDDGAEWQSVAKIEQLSLEDGSIFATLYAEFTVATGQRVLIATQSTDEPLSRLLRVSIDDSVTAALFAEPKELVLAAPKYRVWIEDDRLKVETIGVSVDLVVADVEDGGNLKPESIPLPGLLAVTAVNETRAWQFSKRPRSVVLRSLAGEESIPLG